MNTGSLNSFCGPAIAGLVGLLFASTATAAEPIPVQSVYLRLAEDIDVPAREAGVLATVAVPEGRLVERGELLAQIEDRQASLERDRVALEVDVARRLADKTIEIDFAEKARTVAATELQRAERSRQAVAGAVSQAEVDRLKLEVEKTSSEIRRLEREAETAEITAKLKEAEHALAALRVDRHRIEAPIGGQVAEHYKHRGEWVEPGEIVLRLVRLDVLRAEGFVDAAAMTTVLTGSPVKLVIDLPGRPATEFDGHLTYVAAEVEPTTGQVLVRAEIENESLALRPGLAATMVIHPAEPNATSATATSTNGTAASSDSE